MKRRYFTRSVAAAAAGNSANSSSSSEPRPKRGRPASAAKSSTKIKTRRAAEENKIIETNFKEKIKKLSVNLEDIMAKKRPPPPPQTTIDALPEKILNSIFLLLDVQSRIRVERVCRYWRYVASNYSWLRTKKISYLTFTRSSTLCEHFGSVFHAGSSSADDEISSDDDDDEEPDDHLFNDEDGDILNEERNYEICTCCSKRFRHRHNFACLLSRSSISNDILRSVLDRCGLFLNSVDLSGYRDAVDYRSLMTIGARCPNLENLNMTGVLLTNSSLSTLASKCAKLKIVTLQRCFQDSVVDRGLTALFSQCARITTLNLSENERITGRSFGELPPTLLHMNLSACFDIKDDAIKALANRCPNLESLNLTCCDSLTVDALAYAFERLPALRVLQLGEYYALSDEAHPVAGAAAVRLHNLPLLKNLTRLHLHNNYTIDDVAIAAVARSCTNLETLDISGGNRNLTDDCLMALSRYSNRTLKRLNLNYLPRLTNAGVWALAKCTKLQILLMRRCENIGNSGLMELMKNCHELIKLDVSGCRHVTDVVLGSFEAEAERRRARVKAEMAERKSEFTKSVKKILLRHKEAAAKKELERRYRLLVYVGGSGLSSAGFNFNHPLVKLNFYDVTYFWPNIGLD